MKDHPDLPTTADRSYFMGDAPALPTLTSAMNETPKF